MSLCEGGSARCETERRVRLSRTRATDFFSGAMTPDASTTPQDRTHRQVFDTEIAGEGRHGYRRLRRTHRRRAAAGTADAGLRRAGLRKDAVRAAVPRPRRDARRERRLRHVRRDRGDLLKNAASLGYDVPALIARKRLA